MGILDALFGARSLEGLDGRRRVDVEGTVACDEPVVGPAHGMRGAIIEVAFYVVFTLTDDREQSRDTRAVLHQKLLVGRELRVAVPGGEVVVPAGRIAALRFAGHGYGTPLDRALPGELASVAAGAPSDGTLFCRELALAHGDRVRVRGTFARSSAHESDGYRGVRASSTWIADGPIEIDDLSAQL